MTLDIIVPQYSDTQHRLVKQVIILSVIKHIVVMVIVVAPLKRHCNAN
jgi:hypothetical protein